MRATSCFYAVAGVMRIQTEREAWVVPPDRAVYVPGGTVHSVAMRGAVEMRTLYVASGAAPACPLRRPWSRCPTCCASWCWALIDEPLLYDEAGRGGAMARLILSEVARARRLPLVCRCPTTHACSGFCAALPRRPGEPADPGALVGGGRRLGPHAGPPVRARGRPQLRGLAPARPLPQRARGAGRRRADRPGRGAPRLSQRQRLLRRLPPDHGPGPVRPARRQAGRGARRSRARGLTFRPPRSRAPGCTDVHRYSVSHARTCSGYPRGDAAKHPRLSSRSTAWMAGSSPAMTILNI